MTKGKITIVHAVNVEPEIEIVPHHWARHGTIFVVPDNEKYTIEKTSEQKDAYIRRLEDMLSESQYQLGQYLDILFPDRHNTDEDDY